MESNRTTEQPGPEAIAPHDTPTANSDWRSENDKSTRSSISRQSPEPGFAHIDGDIDGPGYNETLVDIITVPCPGASPVDTWTRDSLPESYFSRPRSLVGEEYATVKALPGGSILSPAIDRPLPAAQHIWVRQGLRGEMSTARVMLYRHRQLREGVTLDELAEDLLEQIVQHRDPSTPRPLFFICHSVGGLVAKAALVKARGREDLRWLIYNCHGMTFFSTPHRGSSYLSMPNLRYSIQNLLYLDDPLPRSVTDQLRVNNKSLLTMHDSFMDIASEMHLWTFYETHDSQLSGWGHTDNDEVHFSAPLTSIKSGLLASRHEQVYSLESDHAACASFGENNLRIMHSYLSDLSKAVAKAEKLNATYTHHPMRLVEKVKMEIIGFYNDPDPETSTDIRLYVSKHFLHEFFEKGPERCLQERLNTVAARPRRGSHLHHRTSSGAGALSTGALGIWSNVQDIGQSLLGRLPRAGSPAEVDAVRGRASPDIVVTTHASPEPLPPNAPGPYMPASASSRARGLTVPALATPGFHRPSSRSSSIRHPDPLVDDEVTRSFTEPVTSSRTAPTASDSPAPSADAAAVPEEGRQHRASVSTDQRDQLGRAVALEDFTAGFSRPEAAERKFMWIHVPFNNPHWVKSVLHKLAETNHQTYASLLRNDNWVNRQVRGRHAQSHASYIRPGCGFVPADHHASRPPSPSPSGRSSPAPSPAHLYLYLPYLHYDTYKNLVKRRDIIRRRLEHGRARPVPREIADEESLDSRVIWEFIAYDPPLHARRSLDQFGYPSLRDTSERDDDQMLYKLTKRRVASDHRERPPPASAEPSTVTSPASRLMSLANHLVKSDVLPTEESPDAPEDDILDGNVLMVDQLWLWAVDNTTLATFFPKRESHATEGSIFQQADLRNSVYNELNGDLTGRCESALDLAAFTALHAVTVLLDRSSHRDLEVFRIFEEAIGVLTERMTLSLKRFRMQTYRDRISDESDSSDLEDNRSETIKRRHRREMERAERENRENTSALLELRDMDDELNTMKNLFAEQGTAIEAMRDLYDRPELQGGTKYGRAYLDEALQRLDEYTKQVTDMLQRIGDTRNDYEKLLEMVQRQAQVDEVRWSRLQAELASTQNTSVMIFTTFTVIFLPLSFFTSVFGMNTREWGGENNVPLGTIGAISLPASVCLIAASLVAAFSSRVQAIFKFVLGQGRAAVDHAKRQAARLRPRAAREAKRRRRRAKEERERNQRRQRERGYDFWEAVRTDGWKSERHQIPELNRMAASQRRGEGRGARRTWGSK